jgi:hypothetical protein
MEALSQVDWLTLIVGVILGIPITYAISMLVIFHAPRLAHFLESRKLLKKHKTRKQALVDRI